MSVVHPVILCGGSGTRLWPMSRKVLPKPFLPLLGELTLFEQALTSEPDTDGNVARGPVDLADCRDVLVITDGLRVSAIGLDGVCIVVAGNEVLVTTRQGAQAVGKLPGAAGP